MASRYSRVEIPNNPSDLLILIGNILKKHEADGDASPLKQLKVKDLGFDEVMADSDPAQQDHDEAKAAERTAEVKHRDRDNKLKPMREMVRLSRDLLTALHPDNRKALGEWGFSVDDTPRRSAPSSVETAISN